MTERTKKVRFNGRRVAADFSLNLKRAIPQVEKDLFELVYRIDQEAQLLVPRDTGALAASNKFYTTTTAKGKGYNEIVGHVEYGGPTEKATRNAPDGYVRYAKFVHEGSHGGHAQPFLLQAMEFVLGSGSPNARWKGTLKFLKDTLAKERAND